MRKDHSCDEETTLKGFPRVLIRERRGDSMIECVVTTEIGVMHFRDTEGDTVVTRSRKRQGGAFHQELQRAAALKMPMLSSRAARGNVRCVRPLSVWSLSIVFTGHKAEGEIPTPYQKTMHSSYV